MAGASAFECLPTEMIQQIMCNLPDVSSLLSTILTCSSFYHIFQAAEKYITNSTFETEVDLTELTAEALAVIDAAQLQPRTADEIAKFIENHIASRTALPRRWTLREALYLSELHGHVQFFALDYAVKAFKEVRQGNDLVPYLPAEPEELHRIQRALYRFETFCILFRPPRLREFWCLVRFLWNHSIWELAQIGSIQDYLCDLLLPVFNEIAEEDITWGAFEVRIIVDPNDSEHLQHLISLGLAYIHQIVQARTYEERYHLFGREEPKTERGFFEYACGKASYSHAQEGYERLCPKFLNDRHQDPETAFAWPEETGALSIFMPETSRYLRKRGFCFWNTSRLHLWQQIPALDPWSLAEEEEEEEIKVTEMESWRAQIEASSARKHSIYQLGGRGRMRDIDESKLIQSYKSQKSTKIPSLMSIYETRKALDRRKEEELENRGKAKAEAPT